LDLTSETLAIKEEVLKSWDYINQSFDFYAACSSGDGFQVKLNAFTEFLEDCMIPDEKCEFVNKMAIDTIFVVTTLDGGLDKEEAASNDQHTLTRFEWVEIITRLGIAKVTVSVCELSERGSGPANFALLWCSILSLAWRQSPRLPCACSCTTTSCRT
jgi:hypothetical protein